MQLAKQFLRFIVDVYPERLRRDIEREAPALAITASRLALEVMDAETQGKRFNDAVLDPSFPLMARVHFGVADTLKWRVPPEILSAMQEVLRQAADGDFDPLRQLAFAIASRGDDPEAALFRFFIWQAIRLNLLIATWDDPIIEAAGILYCVEKEAEKILADFLRVPDMLDDDIRPLHVLVAAAAEHLDLSAAKFREAFSRHSGVLEEIVVCEQLLGVVRRLDARSAAALWPGESYDEPGSQRIADRYAQHFPSANAVEAQRTRTLRRLEAKGVQEPTGDRFIDIIQQFEAEVG